jgi:DNA repair protein RecO (recombination protein O)
MKQQIVTTGIVLSRNDFQEADRLLTILTPDHGKIKTIAKGVRKPNSKLAGGIELFSISNITFMPGRGDFATLISTRLLSHYANIVKDIKRTMLGYELLKRINRLTEQAAGEEYFNLLNTTFEGLNDLDLSYDLVELWFTMQLLFTTGHGPNLRTDSDGNKLSPDGRYLFDFDAMAFNKMQANGPFGANHIKLMRLGAGTEEPRVLKQVRGTEDAVPEVLKLAKNILKLHVRV